MGAADRGLNRHLTPDREIIPVRVAWNLPSGDDPVARLSDLVVAPFRRAPWPILHQPLMTAVSGATTVVTGDAASTTDLRADFESEVRAGARDDETEFVEFVRRRALLACDRAERRLAGDRYKVPRLMVEQITASAEYHERAEAAAEKVGDDPEDFVARAGERLTEMTAVLSPLAIDVFRAFTSPFHTRAWDVDGDVDRIDQLRELNRHHALVFLPSHRSYVDPLVLNEVLHRHDFPRNHVLSGDNLGFWPVGALARRAGVVFIRRSFGDDAAYKFAMREYLGHLMAKRFNLEWYIEGGRTRTGKLRHPRYGLLRYLVDALGSDESRDAILVPTSIMYEQQSEVVAVVAEQTGATKKSEGLRWMVEYMRKQNHHIGDAKVSFGEPFALRDALAEAGTGAAQLEKVAFRVCAGINSATPVMATSVVTFALLGTRGRALTFAQIIAITEPLIEYLDARGIPGPHSQLRDESTMRATIDLLAEAGVVSCYDAGEEPVWSIPPEQAHVAAFYRNGALHHLLVRAMLEIGMLRAERDADTRPMVDVGSDDSVALRDLLKFEFFFGSRATLRDDLEREATLIDPDWRDLGDSGSAATHLLDRCRTLVAPRALRPIFEAQLMVAERLLEHDDTAAVPDKKEFLATCLRIGRQQLLQGRLHDPDSVSRELYDGAWQVAGNRGLLEPGSHAGRSALVDELRDVLDLIARGAERDAELVQVVLDA